MCPTPLRLALLTLATLALACGRPALAPTDAAVELDDAGADAGADAGTQDAGAVTSVATHSSFGVFGAFTDEFAQFRGRLGLSYAGYQDWAGARYSTLGAKWSRSNLQLVWDFVEPVEGGAFDWNASFGGDGVFEGAARHGVRYLAVFHPGGARPAPGQQALRDPVQKLEAWKRFARAAVERYDGDGVDDAPGGIAIHDWQIGNEIFEWTGSGRTADDYVRWFEAASQAIHDADPTARLVLIAATDGVHLDPFHRDVIARLAARGVRFDAIDLHHWGSASIASSTMSGVPEVQAALADAGVTGVELWSMEHGTYVGQLTEKTPTCAPACSATQVCVAPPDSAGFCVNRCTSSATCPAMKPVCDVPSGRCGEPVQSQADQARSLVYRFAINRALGVSVIDWNNLAGWRCFAGSCGSYFDLLGLVADGWGPGETAADAGKPRLSFYAYRALASRTDLDVAEVLPKQASDAGVYVYPYRHRITGKLGVVAWAESPRQASLAWSAGAAHLTSLLSDAAGTPLRAETLSPAQGRLQVALDETPVWLSEDAAW